MKNNFPLISIITPSYNQGQFIEATIKSVLGQSYPNIEYIVIDALSTDATAEVIDLYKEKISHVIQEKDKGQSDAIVKGFKLAKGELVGWINSDDVLYPDCVRFLVDAYLKTPQAVLFYGPELDIISESGVFVRRMSVHNVSLDGLLRVRNMLPQPGSFYKRESLAKVNYFDIGLKYSMDLDLWIRLLQVGQAVEINALPIAAIREWEGTKTATGTTALLIERRKMLLSHGAKITDKTILMIYVGLLKWGIKETPLIGGMAKFMFKTIKKYM
jgi:glycosyltransferase involved in cell wall biosynthesis